MFNATQATVSHYMEEGLPASKPAKRSCTRCSLGRTTSERCRCACSRAPRAISAAIGCFAPPPRCTRNRPLQLPPLLRRLQPQQSDEPGGTHPRLPTYVSSFLPDAQGTGKHCAVGPPAAAAATPTSASAAEPVWPKTFWIHAVRFGFKTYARCTLWLQNVRFGSNSGCHSGSGAHRRPGHARNPSGQVWTRRAGARSKYKWAGLDTEGQSPEHDEEGCTPLRRAPDCGAASLGDCPCPAGPPAGNRGTPPKRTPPQRAHGRSQNI
jgi:hypothetical protein